MYQRPGVKHKTLPLEELSNRPVSDNVISTAKIATCQIIRGVSCLGNDVRHFVLEFVINYLAVTDLSRCKMLLTCLIS